MKRATTFPSMQTGRLSPTLTGYFAFGFALRFTALFGGLMGVIALATAVDMLDQVATKEHASVLVGLQMALLKLPDLAQEVMPFALLFSAMATFWRMTRSNELVVTRAAGVSVWQFQLPFVAVALAIGVLTTTVLNPFGATLLKRYDRMEATYTSHIPANSAIGEDGLWLRQVRDGRVAVIHARDVTGSGTTLEDVTVYRYDDAEAFDSRIDATRAELAEGQWVLREVRISSPGRTARHLDRSRIKTSLTAEEIYHSFAPPETVSFWELPGFIRLLKEAGFTAEPHELQYHRLLSMPLLLAAMPLIAAAFTLRGHRRGNVALFVTAGVLTGFVLHVLSNLVFAVGLSSHLPVELAAWTPAGVSLVIGVAALLYLEDG